MNEALLRDLRRIVGEAYVVTDARRLEPQLTEWRGAVHGRALAMVCPADSAEVSRVVAACAAAGTGVVPQGGNTGLCGGAVPDDSGTQLLLSLSRLNRIRRVDADDFSMVAEAGCVLADLQRAASDAGRFFPLSLSAEGSCQIGGNLATNAGGINVLRYGTARDQVLGLEVVLADGTRIEGLRSLRKDTAGYDWKQLFIGSEGTLGVITAASLKLYPDPGETSTALVALADAGDAILLLGELRVALGDRIMAFELVSRRAFEFVERHIPGSRLPFAERHDWYVLIEAAAGGRESLAEALLELGSVSPTDAVLAKNRGEAERLWRMRHAISEAQKHEGRSLKHDISVPIGRMREFLAECASALERLEPRATTVVFGHVGDGNLHYNVTLPADLAADPARSDAITDAIYSLVDAYSGSFSAEHGVGVLKRQYLPRYRGGAEIALMRTLKQALDPGNTLNPGKVI